jgi:hypothetical protein
MIAAMPHVLILFVHLLVTVARLAGPGGLCSVVAGSVLVRHQLLILNRGRKRTPNLRTTDRILAGLCTVFHPPGRVFRSAIVLKPSTVPHFHSALSKRLNHLEPPCTDPYALWCGSGRRVTAASMPIKWRFHLQSIWPIRTRHTLSKPDSIERGLQFGSDSELPSSAQDRDGAVRRYR